MSYKGQQTKRDPLRQQNQGVHSVARCAGVLLFPSRMWNSSYWVLPFSSPPIKRLLLLQPCSLSISVCWTYWDVRIINLCPIRGCIQSWWTWQPSPQDAALRLDAVTVDCTAPFGEGVHEFYLYLHRSEISDPVLTLPFPNTQTIRFDLLNISEIQLFSHPYCHFLGSFLTSMIGTASESISSHHLPISSL